MTQNAQNLLNQFEQRIRQIQQLGKITTWEKASDNIHHTHSSNNWKNKAFLKPTIYSDALVFNIIRNTNFTVDLPTYSYYHGHLIETFTNHFSTIFTEAKSTAKPNNSDSV